MCGICGTPFLDEVSESEEPGLCARCGSPPDREAYSFSKAGSVVLYEGVIREMLMGFKFRDDLASGEGLATLFSERFPEELNPKPDLVVPVPLHPRKLRDRGFNQAVILARMLSKRLGAPFNPFVLVRTRYTKPQFEITSIHERRRNVSGAFSVTGKGRDKVDGRSVLLVDDIFTSGSTAGECARALLDSGAEVVEVCTLARSVGSTGDEIAEKGVSG